MESFFSYIFLDFMAKKIIAIDTTDRVLEISFFDDGNLSFYSIDSGKTHSEILLRSINFILRIAQCDVEDVDYFSAITGPGSFTGIRIGMSVIKAFSIGKGISPLGLNSLYLTAVGNKKLFDKRVVVLMDARRNEAYVGFYEKVGEEIVEFKGAMSIPIEGLLGEIDENSVLLVVGDGEFKRKVVDVCKGFDISFVERGGNTKTLIYEILKREREKKLSEIEIKDGFYIRPSDAMKKLNDRSKENN